MILGPFEKIPQQQLVKLSSIDYNKYIYREQGLEKQQFCSAGF